MARLREEMKLKRISLNQVEDNNVPIEKSLIDSFEELEGQKDPVAVVVI